MVGPGHASDELFIVAHAEPTLYKMDMAYAAPLCLGLALADPTRRAVAIEGDGSMLAALGVLTTIGRYRPPNLLVLVLDNQTYGSIWDSANPAIASASAETTDIAAVARACGLEHSETVHTVEEAEEALSRAARGPGPWVVVAKTLERSDVRDRITDYDVPDVFENSLAFARAVRTRAK